MASRSRSAPINNRTDELGIGGPGAARYPDPCRDSRAVVFLGTSLIFFSKKVASIIAFGSRYLGQMTITAVSAMFRKEP
jgi:hypothetical protein